MIDDGIREPGNGPYTKEEATVIRNLQNKQVLGCWWCLNYGYKQPYWPEKKCEFRGHRIICPEHVRQEKEGLIETRGESY